jgi:predicted DNA-binding transcriptional regulator AlpA
MDIRGQKEVNVAREERIWVKVPDAATYFKISRSRLYDLIQRGEFPAVRISERSIRVNVPEAERVLLEDRRVGP